MDNLCITWGLLVTCLDVFHSVLRVIHTQPECLTIFFRFWHVWVFLEETIISEIMQLGMMLATEGNAVRFIVSSFKVSPPLAVVPAHAARTQALNSTRLPREESLECPISLPTLLRLLLL